jgi:hypothetical protein
MLVAFIVIALLLVWSAFSSGIVSMPIPGLLFQEVTPTATAVPGVWGYALQFYGNGVNDIDRVKIPIEPQTPVDVSHDFTLEWWMKASLQDNSAAANCSQDIGWVYGNIMVDRDIWAPGDHGKYGVSLTNGQIAFSTTVDSYGVTLCGSTMVADYAWHHVAVTRNGSTGEIAIYVDGVIDVSGPGPAGDISYRDGRTANYPNEPYLVIGAEKHDAGSEFPSYRGVIDEFRVSGVIRYTADFTPPTSPLSPDADTLGLYHFDEGSGTTALDSATVAGAPTNGAVNVGGDPAGPVYVVSDLGAAVEPD